MDPSLQAIFGRGNEARFFNSFGFNPVDPRTVQKPLPELNDTKTYPEHPAHDPNMQEYRMNALRDLMNQMFPVPGMKVSNGIQPPYQYPTTYSR